MNVFGFESKVYPLRLGKKKFVPVQSWQNNILQIKAFCWLKNGQWFCDE